MSKLITPESTTILSIDIIALHGIRPLIQKAARNDGRVTIMLTAKQLESAGRYSPMGSSAVAVADLVNHLLLKIFQIDQFLSHRLRVDKAHYKSIGAQLQWNEDGTAYFSFNLADLICLPGRCKAQELFDLYDVLEEISIVMIEHKDTPVGVDFVDGRAVLRDLNKDDPFWNQITEMVDNVVSSTKSIRHLFTAVSESAKKGKYSSPIQIIETSLFSTLSRPHQNYALNY